MDEFFTLADREFRLRQFYRVKHDPIIWRAGLPEVFRLDPDIHVPLTRERQWLWRNMNPHITDLQWTALLGNTLAFTNGTGFPGKRNWILGQDLDKQDPAFDQTRVCGGAVLCGREYGSKLFIESIDVNKPLPTAEYVLRRRWLYYEAINIDGYNRDEVAYGIIRPFKGNWGKRVYIPLLTVQEMSYPLNLLEKLPLGSIIPSTYQYP